MITSWNPPKLSGRSSGFYSGGLFLLVIAIAVASALLERNKGVEYGLAPGEPLPDYGAMSLDSSQVSILEFRGKVLLLSFWATWCSECVDQLPALQELKDEFGARGLEVVSVSLDDQEPSWVQAFLDGGSHEWLNLFDDPESVKATFKWGRRLPKTILVNQDGTVAVWWRGRLDPTLPENRELIEAALSGKAVWTPEG